MPAGKPVGHKPIDDLQRRKEEFEARRDAAIQERIERLRAGDPTAADEAMKDLAYGTMLEDAHFRSLTPEAREAMVARLLETQRVHETSPAAYRARIAGAHETRGMTQLEAMRFEETMRREARRHHTRLSVIWLVWGLIVAGVLLGVMGGLYAWLGPQPWMAVGGFVFAVTMRSWWRGMP